MDIPENAFSQPITDDEDRLLENIVCLQCKYNLHGLSLDGNCPECGYPVGNSVRRDLLRYADPDWVKRLASGAELVANGFNGFILCIFAIILIEFLTGVLASNGYLTSDTERLANNLGGFLLFIPLGLVVLGLWCFTSSEPGREMKTTRWNHRRIARPMVQLAIFSFIALGFVNTYIDQDKHQTLLICFGLAVVAMILVAWFSLFTYCIDISCRLENSAMVGQTQIAKWGFIISVLAACLINFLTTYFPAPSSLPPAQQLPGWQVDISMVLNLISLLAVLACLLFIFWAIALVFQYRKALRYAARSARTAAVNHHTSQADVSN